jgi:hypothetical protein
MLENCCPIIYVLLNRYQNPDSRKTEGDLPITPMEGKQDGILEHNRTLRAKRCFCGDRHCHRLFASQTGTGKHQAVGTASKATVKYKGVFPFNAG